MPKLVYERELPDSEEFRRTLAEAEGRANPVDDLLELSDDLRAFERRFQMPSPEFYERYQAGSLDDELQHLVEWAATYDLFLNTKRKLEAALMRAAVEPEMSLPA